MASRWTDACTQLLLLCAFAPFPLASASSKPQTIAPDGELERLVGEREVVFLARELDRDQMHAFSRERVEERHPPFSTFKIPNFLIALETGTVVDPGAFRDWDPALRPADDFWPDSWKRSQSLETAFRRSAVWLFRDIALEVGGAQYRRDLARFDYGNQAAADGNDGFWLDGTLQISPLEQVDFLTGLLQGEFGIAPEHMATLRTASLLEEVSGCRLHGKTGAGPVGEDFDGPFEGWLVGWSQCGEAAPTVFALWTRGSSFTAIRDFRQQAAIGMLQHIGALQDETQENKDMTTNGHIHHAIDYIEIPVTDLARAKRFYGEAFGWTFNDYGDQYVGIRKPGAAPDEEAGGFRPVDSVTPGGVLTILYSEDLEASLAGVKQAGGRITQEPFDFPGGRRFQFADPDGHELAVWTAAGGE